MRRPSQFNRRKVSGYPSTVARLLVRCGDEIYTTEPLCSHMGTDLPTGRSTGARALKCPLHGALFDSPQAVASAGATAPTRTHFLPYANTGFASARNDVFLQREQDWVGTGSVSSGQVEERSDTDYRDGDTHELVQLRLFLTKQDPIAYEEETTHS